MAWNPWTHQDRHARPEHCGHQTGTRNADDRVASDARRDGARDLSRWRAPPIATTSRGQYLFTTKHRVPPSAAATGSDRTWPGSAASASGMAGSLYRGAGCDEKRARRARVLFAPYTVNVPTAPAPSELSAPPGLPALPAPPGLPALPAPPGLPALPAPPGLAARPAPAVAPAAAAPAPRRAHRPPSRPRWRRPDWL